MAKGRTDKKVTLIDVAQDAGVSRATASLVLRKSNLVAESTRARVLASMKKLGYIYNHSAASLRAQRSFTIGLVVTNITNPFFAELAISIETQLDSDGYSLLLSNTLDQLTKQDRLLMAMNGRQVDGLLFCPSEGTTQETLERLNTWNLPFVLVSRKVKSYEADYAGADNKAGAKLAVNHLIQNGHRRIAFLGGAPGSSARYERIQGMCDGLIEHGITWDETLSVPASVSRQGGMEALASVMSGEKPPTAALCYNDVVAFGVMLGLQSRGLQPGKDFSLVGFDDIEDASLVRPALTTIAIHPKEIGKHAIHLLMERISNPELPVRSAILSPTLVVRETTRMLSH